MYTNTAWLLLYSDCLNTLTYVHKHSMDPPAQGQSQYTHLCTQTQHGCSCTVTVSIHSLMYTNTAWILQHRDSLNTLTYVHKHSMIINKHSMDPPAQGRSQYTHLCTQTQHGCSCTVTVSIHSLMYTNTAWILQHRDSLNTLTYVHKHSMVAPVQ